jgi:hypothetical protein
MITGWQITNIEEHCFYIRPIIKEDPNPEDIWGLSYHEHAVLKKWGLMNVEDDLVMMIYKMRQVDILEADFKDTDISEIRKLAEKMKFPW